MKKRMKKRMPKSDDEDVFLPIDEELKVTNGNVRVETDKMSLYAFLSDFSLYLFIGIAIYFGIDRWAGGQAAHQQFQMIMIGLGIIAIIWILVDRNRAKLCFVFEKIKKVRVKTIIAVSNILVLVIVILALVFTDKISWNFVKETIVVATWEQLIFSITIPYLFVRTFQVVFRFKNFNLFAATIATVISGILFGIVHCYAYSFDWGVIGYLILIGIGLHSFGYYFPSSSIVIHAIINMSAVALGIVY